jgi:catechol 2,3-dioxygenase-like lactoylglutathione lyase family enzyme
MPQPHEPTETLKRIECDRARGRGAAANRLGIGHIAFGVDDVHAALDRVVAHGGHPLGQVQAAEVPGRGKLTFVYATDPEGNMIELQAWHLPVA